MKSRARQLVKKLKANKDLIGWTDQGQMVFKGRPIPGTNVVDLVNDSLRQRKNFNPAGWQLFAKALGNMNVPEGIIRNENRLSVVREYKTKDISDTTPLTSQVAPATSKRTKRRDKNLHPYKWVK